MTVGQGNAKSVWQTVDVWQTLDDLLPSLFRPSRARSCSLSINSTPRGWSFGCDLTSLWCWCLPCCVVRFPVEVEAFDLIAEKFSSSPVNLRWDLIKMIITNNTFCVWWLRQIRVIQMERRMSGLAQQFESRSPQTWSKTTMCFYLFPAKLVKSPSQRSVRDCSPLKESLERAPTVGEHLYNFYTL